jgi:hypothetical protein
MDLQPEIELLLMLDEAYFTPAPKTGKREPITRFEEMGGGSIQHHAVPDGFTIDDEELVLLESQGLIDRDFGTHHDSIRVTPSGHRIAEAMRALVSDSEPEQGAAIRLDWAEVALPTLEATQRAWTARGAPAAGMPISAVTRELNRDEGDREIHRVVALLVERGYLGAPSGISANDAPALVTVTSLGLEVVGGWPATSAEAATAALLAALDREIEATDEPGQRGRLERLRDTAVEVGTGTLTQVLAHIIKGGL